MYLSQKFENTQTQRVREETLHSSPATLSSATPDSAQEVREETLHSSSATPDSAQEVREETSHCSF